MANRNYLNEQDPKVRRVVNHLYERIEALEAQLATLGKVTQPLDTSMNANGQTITGLKHAVQAGEAVPFDQLQQYVDAAIKQSGV